MSYKSNGIKLTKCDSQQWKTASILDTPSVKLAGEEAKDRLYEPKHKKKLVRVLTVVAYVFFVSLAAIMLSLYYVFLWNGEQRVAAKLQVRQQQQQQQPVTSSYRCENVLAEIQKHIKLMDKYHQRFMQTMITSTIPPLPKTIKIPETTTTWPDEDFSSFEDLKKGSTMFKKLLNDYPYSDVSD